MNLHRNIASISIDVRSTGTGYTVRVTTAYCESTIGGGKIKKEITGYDRLSRGELTDVLDAVTDGPMPGEEWSAPVEYSLFSLV